MQNLKASCKERFAPAVFAVQRLADESEKEQIIIAVDGRCASGKSTLGQYLQDLFDANLFHMDDFFLQRHQRTEERLAEVGGNVDYERFQTEVLVPLLAGKDILYRRFDCKSMTITDGKWIKNRRITIIEGSYCGNAYFGDIYDLKIFTDIDSKSQLANIRNRNGEEKLQVFKERWIPKEEAYFEKFMIKEKSDIVIEWRKPFDGEREDDLYSNL